MADTVHEPRIGSGGAAATSIFPVEPRPLPACSALVGSSLAAVVSIEVWHHHHVQRPSASNCDSPGVTTNLFPITSLFSGFGPLLQSPS